MLLALFLIKNKQDIQAASVFGKQTGLGEKEM
jgi:hypothetical protein